MSLPQLIYSIVIIWRGSNQFFTKSYACRVVCYKVAVTNVSGAYRIPKHLLKVTFELASLFIRHKDLGYQLYRGVESVRRLRQLIFQLAFGISFLRRFLAVTTRLDINYGAA